MSLSPDTSAALARAGLDVGAVEALVRAAIAEDLAGGLDVTTVATVAAGARARLELVARQGGVVAGVPVAAAVYDVVGDCAIIGMVNDATRVTKGTSILAVDGAVSSLLVAERTSLNLLCHLSGVATLTRRWVDAVSGTGAVIRDTRKTTPGLRALEKYAVRCGGGTNHRMSLSDAALVKDNHVVAAGGVAAAFSAVRERWPDLPVEVEVDSLEQLDEVLAAGADLVLLDNFSLVDLSEAVRRNDGRARLEASGGLTLENAAEVAYTGVDYLAVGALTHSAPVLDIGADLGPAAED